jgi:aminoglycoside/choline kinase family phosphotransferase
MSRSASELLADLRAVARRCAAGDDDALIAFPDLIRDFFALVHVGPAASSAEKAEYEKLWDAVHAMIEEIIQARWAAASLERPQDSPPPSSLPL